MKHMGIEQKIILIFAIVSYIVLAIGAFTVNYGLMLVSLNIIVIGLLAGTIAENVSKKAQK